MVPNPFTPSRAFAVPLGLGEALSSVMSNNAGSHGTAYLYASDHCISRHGTPDHCALPISAISLVSRLPTKTFRNVPATSLGQCAAVRRYNGFPDLLRPEGLRAKTTSTRRTIASRLAEA